MNIDTKKAKKELKMAADSTEKVYKKAKKHFPSVKKEITVKTIYYQRQGSKHPCAETFFKLCIDCNLLKALLFLLAVMISTYIFCAMRRKKKQKKCKNEG